MRTSAEKEALHEQLQRLKISLQLSERDRSLLRDHALTVFAGAKSLVLEVDAVTLEGRRALEEEKRKAFLVEQALGQLKVCGSGRRE